jgi:hypothetical protein
VKRHAVSKDFDYNRVAWRADYPAQRALAIGCTPQQFQQCANLPLADTCFK